MSAWDWVEVRSGEEILNTLDDPGESEGLPCGPPFPRQSRQRPINKPTPMKSLNLQPGESVRVKLIRKSLQHRTRRTKIADSFSTSTQYPTAAELPCNEAGFSDHRREDGRHVEMKHPCIILEDVVCQPRYNACRMLCPRAIYSYWREIWLERVPEPEGSVAKERAQQPTR